MSNRKEINMVKDFNIRVEMEERWIPYFQSFLKQMERNGKIGHSSMIAFFADGDGDFRPTFDFNIPFEKVEAKSDCVDAEYVYDAG